MALTDNLVSYWALGEASGNRADSHGSNTLADNNTVTSAAGKVGDAAEFAIANSEFLNIADNAALSMGSDTPFTIAAWVRATSFAANFSTIVMKDVNATVSSAEYWLFHSAGGGIDTFRFTVSNSGGFGSVDASGTLGTAATATWYYVVAWHDEVADTLNIQINNGSVASASYSGGTRDTAHNFGIGGYPYAGFGAYNWNGLIDEVGFWKRVLTSDERTSLYNGGAGFAYPFSGGATSILRQMMQLHG